MKYYFFVTVFLFGSFFVGQKSLAINSDIVINEIGAYPTSTHEWIEIWNRGAESIDIKNWKFWENNTNHSFNMTTSSDSIVSAGEFAVICQDSEMFLIDYPNFIGSIFDSSWINLTENGESIGLKDEAGNFVEQFSYVSTTKYSLERKNPFLDDYSLENWQENISGNTVGAQNSNYSVLNNNLVTTTTDSSSTLNVVTSTDSLTTSVLGVDIFNLAFVKINEIISDPSDGNELVELFNSGSSTVDLSGASICDSSGGGCFLLSGLIVDHDWLVADLLTDRYLNNTGDAVILKDKNNNIVDQINYGTASLAAPEKGQSLIRKVDGIDTNLDSDWAVTNKITLNSANELVLPVVANNVGSGGGVTANNNSKTVTSSTSILKANKSSTTTKSFVVEPKDPVNISWKLDWPYGLDVGEMGIFSAKGSADPRGGEVNFVWNFGDNTSGTGHLYGHSFASSGIYFVSVVASSTAGTVSKKEFKVIVGSSFSINNSDLKISSWLVTSTDDIPDYIELKNNLNKPQNISGWKIKNKSGKEYELPDNTIISASGTLKFFKSIHHLSFDKNSDVILLTSPNDKEMSKVLWTIEKNKTKEVKNNPVKSSKISSNWLSVHGVVTVESKTFGQQFFYISDSETSFQIYQYKKDFPDLKIGDEISVAGEASEIGGVKRIKIKNKFAIDILATNKKIEPIDLKIEEVNEEMLGSLVKISGDITEIKSNLMYVDDGTTEISVYFKKGAKINKQEIKEGDKIEVVGILNQGKDGWQILPRAMTDINVVGHADEVLAGRLSAGQGAQNETTKKYLTTTAGGLTALLLGFLVRARGALLITSVKKVASLAASMIKRG